MYIIWLEQTYEKQRLQRQSIKMHGVLSFSMVGSAIDEQVSADYANLREDHGKTIFKRVQIPTFYLRHESEYGFNHESSNLYLAVLNLLR